MSEPSSKRAYRNPLADYQDQALFFGLFVVGAAGIWTLKTLEFNQITTTAFPLLLMAIYAGVALMTKRYRLREDRVGDNIYYLGFLFTLVSLSYALYGFNSGDPSQIITNFGIAIFTTIFGLAGRVLFNQMREDPVEYERESRQSLAEATSALRAQLADISVEMSTFKRKIVQITEEGVTDISASAREAMQASASQFSEATTDVLDDFKKAFSDLADRSTKFSEAAASNTGALNSLSEKIKNIDVTPDVLTGKFTPIMDKFGEVADEATKRTRTQTGEFKRVRESMEASVAAANALREALTQSNEMLGDNFLRFSASLAESMKEARGALVSVADAANALAAEASALRATARIPTGASAGAEDTRPRAGGWNFGLFGRAADGS